jgi:ASC-1-like (ASCH) protein
MSNRKKHEEELPRLFFHTYSKFERPRRMTKKLPSRHRGMVCRSIEFRNGVKVDREGHVQPLTEHTNATPLTDSEEDSYFSQEDSNSDPDYKPEQEEAEGDVQEEEDSEEYHSKNEATDNESSESEKEEEKTQTKKRLREKEAFWLQDEKKKEEAQEGEEANKEQKTTTTEGTTEWTTEWKTVEPYYSYLASGEKVIEARCGTKYKDIKVGDVIHISNNNGKSLLREIKRVTQYSTFEELFTTEGFSLIVPNITSVSKAVALLESFYPKREGPVFAFELTEKL